MPNTPIRPDIPPRLRTNVLWNGIGNCVFSACQWGILITFAKLGTPGLVGQLSYGLAVTTPIFTVASLQLRSVETTDISGKYKFGHYSALRVITTVIAITLTLFIALIAMHQRSPYWPAILLWGAARLVEAGSDTFYGLFQRFERFDYVAISMSLRALLSVLSVGAIFYFTRNLSLALLAIGVSWLLVFACFDIVAGSALKKTQVFPAQCNFSSWRALLPSFDWKPLRQLFREAWPLGLVAFLFAVQLQIPRYVVALRMGESQLGLFSAANYLTIVGTTLVTALGAPSAVKLAKYYTAGNAREFKHLVFKLMSVGAAIGMMGIITSILAGKQILELAYKKQYAEMSGVLTVLCVASAVAYSSSFIGWAMTAAGKFKVQVPIFLFLAAFTGCTCYVFIGRYGIAGAALGVLAGSIAQLALTALVIGRAVRECDQDRCTREKQLYEGAY